MPWSSGFEIKSTLMQPYKKMALLSYIRPMFFHKPDFTLKQAFVHFFCEDRSLEKMKAFCERISSEAETMERTTARPVINLSVAQLQAETDYLQAFVPASESLLTSNMSTTPSDCRTVMAKIMNL